jgi:hypothetical protein
LEKHTAYFNLLEQLKQPGCPVCAQLKKSLRGFLDSYLYEGVTDDANWNRLSASGGWCARHAHDLEGFSDGLAVALYYRFEIRKRIKNLDHGSAAESFWSRVFGTKKALPCPGCVYEEELESGQISMIASAAGEPEFWAAFEKHPGLCLPHSLGTLRRLSGEGRRKYLAQASSSLEALCAELDGIVEKSDYRSKEKMGAEGDAWKRALRRLYGPQYPG